MSYFYIKIKEKKEIELLIDTVELIKENCIKSSNKYSIILNKKDHSNCILDNHKNHLNVYEKNKDFHQIKTNYISKYNLSNEDVDIILQQYNNIDIDLVEECKIQVKITYNNFISAISLIVDLLGSGKPFNKILKFPFNNIFNQIITNNDEYDSAIIDNNVIYYALFDNGGYIKKNKYEKNDEILVKYLLYKSLNGKLSNKELDKTIKI